MHKLYLLASLVYLTFLTTLVVLANNSWADWLFKFSGEFFYADKVGHFFLMGILSFLVNSAFKCKEISIGSFKLLLGSLIVAILVISEEVSQVLVESRNADLIDMLFDVFGIYLFGLLATYIQKRHKMSMRI